MNKKLINDKTEPSCMYCEYGRVSPGKVSVLCLRKGVVATDSSCRKFRYDPLKREPRVAPEPEKANAEDYEF